jgi:hypothetical protein
MIAVEVAVTSGLLTASWVAVTNGVTCSTSICGVLVKGTVVDGAGWTVGAQPDMMTRMTDIEINQELSEEGFQTINLIVLIGWYDEHYPHGQYTIST